MLNEEWRDVGGYESLYQISNLGRVKSLSRVCRSPFGVTGLRVVRERIRKVSLNSDGYPLVRLSKEGRTELFLIHRLVAAAFLKKAPGKDWVNHKDLDKTNNCATNLEWCTPQENDHHATLFGAKPKGSCHGMSKLTEESVRQIKQRLRIKDTIQRKLAKEFGVSVGTLQLIKKGRTWVHVK